MPRAMLIGLALAGIAAVAASIYGLGRKSVEAEITIQNQEAGDAADRHSSMFQRCVDAGGVFDFATGECRKG